MTLSLSQTSRSATHSHSLKPIFFALKERSIANLIRACLSPEDNTSLDRTNRGISNTFLSLRERFIVHLTRFESKVVYTPQQLVSMRRFADAEFTLDASDLFTSLDRVLELVTIFKKITCIHLSGRVELSDEDLLSLYSLKRLHSLDLSGCTTITNQGLSRLLVAFPQLRSLDLPFCHQITDQGLEPLANLRKLQDLNLAKCSISDQSLRYLQHLFFLESLDLFECNFITGEGLSYLSTLSRLQILSLPRIITDESLVFLRKLSLLNDLNLSGARMLTNEGLKHLENLSLLEKLHLESCVKISDEGFNYLQKLSRLSFLDLTNCQAITDEGLQRISRYFPKLQTLILSDCPNITDRGLEHLHRLPLLEVIHVSSDLISDAAIQAFHDLRPNIVITRIILPPLLRNSAVPEDLATSWASLNGFELIGATGAWVAEPDDAGGWVVPGDAE